MSYPTCMPEAVESRRGTSGQGARGHGPCRRDAAGRRKGRAMAAAVVAAAAAVLGMAGTASGQNFYWGDMVSANPGIVPSAFLRDNNVAQVDAFLAAQPVKAVKIDTPLSAQTINSIFNKYQVDYVFIDYEGTNAAATAGLVTQLKASTATGPALSTGRSYVSNFDYTPASYDSTATTARPLASAYFGAGLNMAADGLYPGSASFRNPAAGNSTAPNIRSALFTEPITRLTFTTSSLPAGHKFVPYVDRFNNWGNGALDSDKNAANGFAFVTADQLPSRGDFKAQVLHYRLRGAGGVHGLEGGVLGYTPEQFQQDIADGWSSVATVNQVLSDAKARLAVLDTQVTTDGTTKSMEQAGVALSGAYSAAQGKLVLLVSNMDEKAHSVLLPKSVGGKAVGGTYLVEAGTHQVMEFSASGSRWNLLSNGAVFVDADRAGVGVPEPAALGLLGALAVPALLRRRRR